MIWQDHVIKGSCVFMCGTLLWYVITLASLVAIAIVVVEIRCLLWLKGIILHVLAEIRHYCLSLKHMASHVQTYGFQDVDTLIFIYLFIFKIFIMVVSVYIYMYIFTKYIKITAFQTSTVEKERDKRLNRTFQLQISSRNYCKFQAETRIKISK